MFVFLFDMKCELKPPWCHVTLYVVGILTFTTFVLGNKIEIHWSVLGAVSRHR